MPPPASAEATSSNAASPTASAAALAVRATGLLTLSPSGLLPLNTATLSGHTNSKAHHLGYTRPEATAPVSRRDSRDAILKTFAYGNRKLLNPDR